MTQQLQISTELSLPIGIANKTICLFGKGGSGKSNLEVVLAEELYRAGIPTCIVDPADIHYGIKSSRDGKSAGLPFIVFGGLHADVQIFPENGALLADLFLGGLYMVIVTQPWTGGERSRFMTDFANQLYKRGPEKEQRGSARVLMLEEAHEYVPLIPGKGEEVMLGAMKRLYTVGRNYWIGFVAATRRPAKMHTDLRNGADATAFFQIVGTQDRKAMQDYLGENAPEDVRKEILAHLAKLPVGTAYFYQPDQDPALQRLHFRHRNTFDTTTTEITAAHKAIKPVLAEVDLTKLGEAMTAAREKAKADDPRELRKRIRELEAERIGWTKMGEVREIEKIVEVPAAIDEALLKQLAEAPDMLRTTADTLIQSGGHLQVIASAIGSIAKSLRSPSSRVPARLHGQVAKPAERAGADAQRTAPRAPAVTSRPAPPAGNGSRDFIDGIVDNWGKKLTGPQQRIVDALYWLLSVRIPQAKKVQVALLAGASPKSSAYTNNLGALRSEGLVEYPGPGLVALTERGQREANTNVSVPRTSEELHRELYTRLSGPQQRILQALIEAYPGSMAKYAVADRAGASAQSSAFTNNLGALRSLGLIDYPAPGMAVATEVLFLESRVA